MKQGIYKVLSNEALTSSVWKMVLEGDTSAITASGQFVDIVIEGRYLRRPISICDYSSTTITLVYKVVGKGTAWMATRLAGDSLDLLVGLGNGFSPKMEGSPLLVGGGVGVPPLYNLARRMVLANLEPTIVLGFNTASEIFFEKEFRALGCKVIVTTADGSYGTKGFVTHALPETDCDRFYACGPLPMLKALCGATEMPGQVSLEERMGCGFGACMGCTHTMVSGPKRICKDGPVFEREEVIW